METTLRKLKTGDYLTIYKLNYPCVIDIWVRGKYDRKLKKYKLFKYNEPHRYFYESPSYIVYPVLISLKINYV